MATRVQRRNENKINARQRIWENMCELSNDLVQIMLIGSIRNIPIMNVGDITCPPFRVMSIKVANEN